MFDQYVLRVLLIGAARRPWSLAAWPPGGSCVASCVPSTASTERPTPLRPATWRPRRRAARPGAAPAGGGLQPDGRDAGARRGCCDARLVEDVAHELRTPLTSLRGFTEALADGVVEPTPEMLRTVHDEIERLTRLVEELDQLVARRAHAQQPRSRRGRSRRSGRSRTRSGVSGAVEPGDRGLASIHRGLRSVLAEPDDIGQVVTNLVQNAARYTDDGGAITVRLAADGDGCAARREHGDTDSADELPLIWERLHRVDRSRARASGGAGIGLAIVRQIVEGHGGSVGAKLGRRADCGLVSAAEGSRKVGRAPGSESDRLGSVAGAALGATPSGDR